MGNSLQDYRARIGSFSNKFGGVKKTSGVSEYKKKPNYNSYLNIILLLVLTISISVNSNVKNATESPSKITYIAAHGNHEYPASSGKVINHNFIARYTHGNKKNGIKLAHINLGGGFIINKMNEIESIIADYKPHILGISETRFEAGQDLEDIKVNNYKTYLSSTLDNPKLKTSRVAVLVHQDVVVKERLDLMNDMFSSIWLEVGLKRQKKILVANVYRDWQYLHQENNSSKCISEQLVRWSSFLDQWEMAVLENRETLVLGDVNIDFLQWSTTSQPSSDQNNRLKPLVTQLLDRIIPHGFIQVITEPTHTWPGQKPSGLDHIYTNHPGKLSGVRADYNGTSDHKLITAIRNSKDPVSRPRIVRKRCYKNFDPCKFLEAVRNISWWEIYSCEDLDTAVQLFTNKLNNILNVMAPVKKIQVRTKYAPLISDNTKLKIKNRKQAHKIASETGRTEDWNHYKSLRNSVTNTLKKEKEIWQKEKMDEYANDSSSTWRNIGWTSGEQPSKLSVNGIVYQKPADLARIMNEFFINKVRNLRSNLPVNPESPLKKVEQLMAGQTCSFKLRCAHPDEVLKQINNLKLTKSCGTDNIDSYVIKLAKHELVPVITHLINLSITQRRFPSLWKCAKVVPLHKKDEVIFAKNYRPVALLPITSKLLEKVIFCQLVEYLEENELLHPSHHGFRAKHNTSTALLQMNDIWLDALEHDEISAVIMLDMSAAFDVVDHPILLDKLKSYGLQNCALSWLESYLIGRKQRVLIDGCLSDPLDLEAGVPQGSILGPLLYICFTNDLPEVVHDHLAENNTLFNVHCSSCGGICCFADDSTYSISSKDPEILKQDIDNKYKLISRYMASNKLVLNTDKTHLLVMCTAINHRKNENHGITLNTGSEIIYPIKCEKLLGGMVSNDFLWNNHIRDDKKSLFRNLVSRINAMNKISRFSSFKTRKMIANGVIMSRLIYLIQLWGGSSFYLIRMLQILQNRAARLVTKLGWYSPVKTQCGWLSVHQLVHFHSLLLAYKIRAEEKPKYFCDKLKSSFDKETRLATSGGIRKELKIKHKTTQQSFIPRTVDLWNKLPQDLRQTLTLPKFKKKLKLWIIQNIPIHPSSHP